MDHIEEPLHVLLVEKGGGQPYLTHYIFNSFNSFFQFYIGEEEKKSKMARLVKRGRILVALTLY